MSWDPLRWGPRGDGDPPGMAPTPSGSPQPQCLTLRGAPHLVITFRGAPAHDLGVLGVGGALLSRHRGGGSCRGESGEGVSGTRGTPKPAPERGSTPSCPRGGLHHRPGSADFSLLSRQHQKAPPRLTASRMRVRTMYPDLEKAACPPTRAERERLSQGGTSKDPPLPPLTALRLSRLAPKGARHPLGEQRPHPQPHPRSGRCSAGRRGRPCGRRGC